MAWKSTTFKRFVTDGRPAAGEAISSAIAKNRDAMNVVVHDAKELAEERRRTLSSIQDPELKRSAAR